MPTVNRMEIEGTMHDIEDTEARGKALVPVVNSDNEITALTSSGGTSRELADVKARSLIQNINSYSTAEVDTGRVWIDGKKVYKKVINYEETTIHGDNGFNVLLESGIDTLVSHCLYRCDAALPDVSPGGVYPVQGWAEAVNGYLFSQTLTKTSEGGLWYWTAGNLGILRVYGEIYYTKLSE